MEPEEQYMDLDGPDPEHMMVTTILCERGHLSEAENRCIGCLNGIEDGAGGWQFYCNECGLIAGKGYEEEAVTPEFIDGVRLVKEAAS